MTNLPFSSASPPLLVKLARIVGAHAVSALESDRFAYSRDCWPRDLIQMRAGMIPASPACIVWPETAEEVSKILLLASELGIPVVPYGAGSGVCGGARPVDGGITIDFKRMKSIRQIDEVNLTAEVETGIIGERLERRLNQRGYTLGHFPSSIVCSTLGGWLAARSAGQTSTFYGKIEDMVLGLETVSPGRVRKLTSAPRAGLSVDYNALMMGSEGVFGAITAATLRIHPFPESRLFRGFRFPNVQAGITAIRKMLRVGLKPAVVRLYDALDTFIGRGHGKGGSSDESSDAVSFESISKIVASRFPTEKLTGNGLGRRLAQAMIRKTVSTVVGTPLLLNRAIDALPEQCLLILGFEGQSGLIRSEMDLGISLCTELGAEDLGEEPGLHWLANRHNVSYKQSKAYASGVFTDTMEVAANWERLLPVYQSVRRAISKEAFVMAHFSHAYPDGCSIYFTFAGAAENPRDPNTILERYDRIWAAALPAANDAGGTVSHHHGIGILKAHAMEKEHGRGGMTVLRALKAGFDPQAILNPGKLGLEAKKVRRNYSFHTKVKSRKVLPEEIHAAVGASNIVKKGGRTSIRPTDESSLAAVLREANRRQVTVSNDQTGFRSPMGSLHLDLSGMNGVVRLSKKSLFVEAEAGITVHELENVLRKQGLTLGHVHPRCLSRSIGAGLAFNTLVRRANGFGDLGGVCIAVRGLLCDGTVVETRPVPRSAAGPELDRAFIGGAGRWGVMTRAVLRVVKLPKLTKAIGYKFERADMAIKFGRRVSKTHLGIGAARILHRDNHWHALHVLHAQHEQLMKVRQNHIAALASECGGEVLETSEAAVTGGRFDAVVELAAKWDTAEDLYKEVMEAGAEEAWLDFMTAQGMTLVVRIPDRAVRQAIVDLAARRDTMVLSGARIYETSDELSKSLNSPAYADIGATISACIDPSGMFKGRQS